MRNWAALVLGTVVMASVLGACGDDDGDGGASGATTSTTAASGGPTTLAPIEVPVPSSLPPVTSPNLTPSLQIVNGGFEDGLDPWFALQPPEPELDTEIVRSGEASAKGTLDVASDEEGVRISYIVQDLDAEQLPERLAGAFRVDEWVRGGPKQYVQFVVIVIGADNDPAGVGNFQIRYPLAGIAEEPFRIDNAKFVFLGSDEPRLGEWVTFERDLRADFEEQWGVVPEGAEFVRFLFEARIDQKVAGEGPARAVVNWDDIETSG